MKDIHKNPIFYFLVVPVIIGIWPLLVCAVYLPRTQSSWKIEKMNSQAIETKEKAHKLLKTYFGYDSFRSTQYEVIEKVMNKKDVVLLMRSYLSDQ